MIMYFCLKFLSHINTQTIKIIHNKDILFSLTIEYKLLYRIEIDFKFLMACTPFSVYLR